MTPQSLLLVMVSTLLGGPGAKAGSGTPGPGGGLVNVEEVAEIASR